MPATLAESAASSATIDATRCPLCGQANGCAMARAAGTQPATAPCWCRTGDFPPALCARVPPAAQGRACICARCAQAHAASHPPLKAPP